MDEEKVYRPAVIADAPFPQEGSQSVYDSSQTTGNDTYSPQTIQEQGFPTRHIAVEVIGEALNTQSRKILGAFEFTQSGALQIGKYENGVSGDVRISPGGIVARDMAGNTTFSLDGDTGNATFRGSVQTGSIITGSVVVGNNNVIIDGTNRRMIVNDGTFDRVLIGYQLGGF